MILRIAVPFVLSASLAWADGCPTAPDHEAKMDGLLAAVQAAPNQAVARGYSNEMWTLWLEAPDEPSQMMLDAALRAMRVGDMIRARDRLNTLVGYCPFYAEGYNQRAYMHFLLGDFEAVLPDVDQAIGLNPRHLGALTGKAMTLIRLGRDAEAQEVLRRAIGLNPWLSERALLSGDDL